MNFDIKLLVALSGLAFALPAAAQEEPAPTEPTSPAETFDPDKKPEAPQADLGVADPTTNLKTYAGVGSEWAYGDAGTAEIGGALAFSTSNDTTTFSTDPMIGYFLWDNIELSAIIGYRHVTIHDVQSTNRFSLLVEPSLHMPINDGLFWMVGVGAGPAIGTNLSADKVDAGLALAPRAGLQLLVGRSGLLNLGVRYAAVFSDLDTDLAIGGGQAVLAFTNSLDVQAGYTVMF